MRASSACSSAVGSAPAFCTTRRAMPPTCMQVPLIHMKSMGFDATTLSLPGAGSKASCISRHTGPVTCNWHIDCASGMLVLYPDVFLVISESALCFDMGFYREPLSSHQIVSGLVTDSRCPRSDKVKDSSSRQSLFFVDSVQLLPTGSNIAQRCQLCWNGCTVTGWSLGKV